MASSSFAPLFNGQNKHLPNCLLNFESTSRLSRIIRTFNFIRMYYMNLICTKFYLRLKQSNKRASLHQRNIHSQRPFLKIYFKLYQHNKNEWFNLCLNAVNFRRPFSAKLVRKQGMAKCIGYLLPALFCFFFSCHFVYSFDLRLKFIKFCGICC